MGDDSPFTTDSRPSSGNSRCGARDEHIATEELHGLLASERRRYLLSYLSTDATDPVSRDELVDVVAERERPAPGPGTHRERITVDLHHVHLPKLADAGVIDYDPVAETVYYRGSDNLESLLTATSAVEDEAE